MTNGLQNGHRILVRADAVSMNVCAGHSLLRMEWCPPASRRHPLRDVGKAVEIQGRSHDSMQESAYGRVRRLRPMCTDGP
jgi:hypothetical protein